MSLTLQPGVATPVQKKRVVQEVMLFDGSIAAGRNVVFWAREHGVAVTYVPPQTERIDGSNELREVEPACLLIPTLEGEMRGKAGDLIAKGTHNEFYPINGEIAPGILEDLDTDPDFEDGEAGGHVVVHNHIRRHDPLMLAGVGVVALGLIAQTIIGIALLLQ